MKGYLATMLMTVLLLFAICLAANVWIDPYSLVHPLAGSYYTEPDARVAKMNYLIANCALYVFYEVGDSRAGILSEQDLSEMPRGRFYNLAFPGDSIDMVVKRLRFLLDRGCPVSKVVINDSPDTIAGEPGRVNLGGVFTEHPLISHENLWAFYASNLLSPRPLITYFSGRRRWPGGQLYYHADGHVDYRVESHSNLDLEPLHCGIAKIAPGERWMILNKLSGYRALAELAAARGFHLILWSSPLNIRRQDILQMPFVVQFEAQLRKIPGLRVVEPIAESPVLDDFHYWHDCAHFHREVFDELVKPNLAPIIDSW
jgi:hypothetical protein